MNARQQNADQMDFCNSDHKIARVIRRWFASARSSRMSRLRNDSDKHPRENLSRVVAVTVDLQLAQFP